MEHVKQAVSAKMRWVYALILTALAVLGLILASGNGKLASIYPDTSGIVTIDKELNLYKYNFGDDTTTMVPAVNGSYVLYVGLDQDGKGYGTNFTNAEEAHLVKAWMPDASTMQYTIPIMSTKAQNSTSGKDILYSWYSPASRTLRYAYEGDGRTNLYNQLVIKSSAGSATNKVHFNDLKTKYDAATNNKLQALLTWRTMVKTDASKQLWTAFADSNNPSDAVQTYLALPYTTASKAAYADWSDAEKSDAFLSYLDLLMTVYGLCPAGSDAQNYYGGMIDRYITEGVVSATSCPFNIAILPGFVMDLDASTSAVMTANDLWKYAYLITGANDYANKTYASVILDDHTANTYYPKAEKVAKYNTDAMSNMNAGNFPATHKAVSFYMKSLFRQKYDISKKVMVDTGAGANSIIDKMLWKIPENGGQVFGIGYFAAMPTTVSSTAAGGTLVDGKFRVEWADEGSRYKNIPHDRSGIADSARFKIQLSSMAEEATAWKNVSQGFKNFEIRFKPHAVAMYKSDMLGDGTKVATRLSTRYKDGTEIFSQNIGAEEFYNLVTGGIIYQQLYDTQTQSQPVNTGEQVSYGYDLEMQIVWWNSKEPNESFNSTDNGDGGRITVAFESDYSSDLADSSLERAIVDEHALSAYRTEKSVSTFTYYTEPTAYAEIKQGTVQMDGTGTYEDYEAMAGTPSTEFLYFASGGSEFILEFDLEYIEGEKGVRWYDEHFPDTECEYKHQDQWKAMKAAGKTVTPGKGSEGSITSTKDSQSSAKQTRDIKSNVIKETFVADNEGKDHTPTEVEAQWYDGYIPTGASSYSVDLTGGHNPCVGKNATGGANHITQSAGKWNSGKDACNSSSASPAIYAEWKGTITNVNGPSGNGAAPGTPYVVNYKEANTAPVCQGGYNGYAGDFSETDTDWDTDAYFEAVEQAASWAMAYEKTNDTFTAMKWSDSDNHLRMWKIGNATISVSFSGGVSNQGGGSRPSGSYSTSNIGSAKKDGGVGSGAASIWGYNHSFSYGFDGTAGTHGDKTSGNPPVTIPHGEDKDGQPTKGSTISNAGNISYTIRVTFDNGTLNAHELCGPCHQHDLPYVFDTWSQYSQYDYAQFKACRVYKIHRSYVDGMEEITFADYMGEEDQKEAAQNHYMASGPIDPYTYYLPDKHIAVDSSTGAWLAHWQDGRKVISAYEQSKRINGTEQIVAAISQGDPNIFYNIALMHNGDTYNGQQAYFAAQPTGHYAHSYAWEMRNQLLDRNDKAVDPEAAADFGYSLWAPTGQPYEAAVFRSFNNVSAGRIRYTLGGYMGYYTWAEEWSQRGGTSEFGTGGRSTKCDGMSQCSTGYENPVVTKSNGHQAPTYSYGNQELVYPSLSPKQGEFGITWATIGGGPYMQAPEALTLRTYSVGCLWSQCDSPYGGQLLLYTDDEFYMQTMKSTNDITTYNNPANVLIEGTLELNGDWQNRDSDKLKTGYNVNYVDYYDWQSEEYQRFKYRRNQENKIFVISDMLILQTSTGDQPVMYHWKSQTKRAQQHFDYTAADVDPRQAAVDEFTSTTQVLKDGFEDMWYNQYEGDVKNYADQYTATAEGWGVNNVGQYQQINIGGYLGEYSTPDTKYSDTGLDIYTIDVSQAMNESTQTNTWKKPHLVTRRVDSFETIFDRNGDMTDVNNMDMASAAEYKFRDGIGFGDKWPEYSTTGGGYTKSEFFIDENNIGYKYGMDPQGGANDSYGNSRNRNRHFLWNYAPVVDSGSRDSYKASPNLRLDGIFNSPGPGGWYEVGEERMASVGGLRLVTDMIEQDPTNENGEYVTGSAYQTYLNILDWPALDDGELYDGLGEKYRRIVGSDGKYDRDEFNNTLASGIARRMNQRYYDETINTIDEDYTEHANIIRGDGYTPGGERNISYEYFDEKDGYTTSVITEAPGYVIDAYYSDAHTKVNDIVVHNPVSVQNALITHNATAEVRGWYSDNRTSDIDTFTKSSLDDKRKALEVCPVGDPASCEFKVLECKYFNDTVLYNLDFEPINGDGSSDMPLTSTVYNQIEYVDPATQQVAYDTTELTLSGKGFVLTNLLETAKTLVQDVPTTDYDDSYIHRFAAIKDSADTSWWNEEYEPEYILSDDPNTAHDDRFVAKYHVYDDPTTSWDDRYEVQFTWDNYNTGWRDDFEYNRYRASVNGQKEPEYEWKRIQYRLRTDLCKTELVDGEYVLTEVVYSATAYQTYGDVKTRITIDQNNGEVYASYTGTWLELRTAGWRDGTATLVDGTRYYDYNWAKKSFTADGKTAQYWQPQDGEINARYGEREDIWLMNDTEIYSAADDTVRADEHVVKVSFDSYHKSIDTNHDGTYETQVIPMWYKDYHTTNGIKTQVSDGLTSGTKVQKRVVTYIYDRDGFKARRAIRQQGGDSVDLIYDIGTTITYDENLYKNYNYLNRTGTSTRYNLGTVDYLVYTADLQDGALADNEYVPKKGDIIRETKRDTTVNAVKKDGTTGLTKEFKVVVEGANGYGIISADSIIAKQPATEKEQYSLARTKGVTVDINQTTGIALIPDKDNEKGTALKSVVDGEYVRNETGETIKPFGSKNGYFLYSDGLTVNGDEEIGNYVEFGGINMGSGGILDISFDIYVDPDKYIDSNGVERMRSDSIVIGFDAGPQFIIKNPVNTTGQDEYWIGDERSTDTFNLTGEANNLRFSFNWNNPDEFWREFHVYLNGKEMKASLWEAQGSATPATPSTMYIGSPAGGSARFAIDNLKVTKQASGVQHTAACYKEEKIYEKGFNYLCMTPYVYETSGRYEGQIKNGTYVEKAGTARPYLFTVPVTGKYRMELWGASGGDTAGANGGNGGYISGFVFLEKGEQLMIYPGGQGEQTTGGGPDVEYLWGLTTGCGNISGFENGSFGTPVLVSSVIGEGTPYEYKNSVNGKVQSPSAYGVWSKVNPKDGACGNHSFSILFANGKPISRVSTTATTVPSTVSIYTKDIAFGGASADGNTLTWDSTKGCYVWTAPYSGSYMLEGWGAQGGGNTITHVANDTTGDIRTHSSHGGAGGYAAGTTYFDKGDKLYIFIGGAGSYAGGAGSKGGAGYNGGGMGSGTGYGGGGMTHMSFSDKSTAAGTVVDYGYTGGVQKFTAPYSGTYKLEAWGAAGGDARVGSAITVTAGTGGKGGYAAGYYYLNKGETIYVYVGQKGADAPATAQAGVSHPNAYHFGHYTINGTKGYGAWNGGGTGGTELKGTTVSDQPENSAGGGGMTHFSKVGTDNLRSYSRIWSNHTQNESKTVTFPFTVTTETGDYTVVYGTGSSTPVTLYYGHTYYVIQHSSGCSYGTDKGTYYHLYDATAGGDCISCTCTCGHTVLGTVTADSLATILGKAWNYYYFARYYTNNQFAYDQAILVAGGGGGAGSGAASTVGVGKGGDGGGTSGSAGGTMTSGGTQTSGFQFTDNGVKLGRGYGKSGYSYNYKWLGDTSDGNYGAIGGAGAGYWGGTWTDNKSQTNGVGGAGGSSYIGGVSSGTTTAGVRSGNGYARISYVEDWNNTDVILAAGGGGGADDATVGAYSPDWTEVKATYDVPDPFVGELIDSDDDAGSGLNSTMTVELEVGDYLLGVGRYSTAREGTANYSIVGGSATVTTLPTTFKKVYNASTGAFDNVTKTMPLSGTVTVDEGSWSSQSSDPDAVIPFKVTKRGTVVLSATAGSLSDPCTYVSYMTTRQVEEIVKIYTPQSNDGSGGAGGTSGEFGTVAAENGYIDGYNNTGASLNTGATQTTGNAIGRGQSSTTTSDSGGAGGGWYGGKTTNHANGGGGGGSSYVAGNGPNGAMTKISYSSGANSGGSDGIVNGKARITYIPGVFTDTWSGAGFNGGGIAMANGTTGGGGGGGASDIRRLLNGGKFINKTAVDDDESGNTDGIQVITYNGQSYIKVFAHDTQVGGLFESLTQAGKNNSEGKYSILDSIGRYRDAGTPFQFMLVYPDQNKRIIWQQDFNPIDTRLGDTASGTKVSGFKLISGSTYGYFGGLALSSSSSTYLDTDTGHGNWFGAIGAMKYHPTGSGETNKTIPGPGENVRKVELYMQVSQDVIDSTINIKANANEAGTGELTYNSDTKVYRNDEMKADAGFYQVDIYGDGLNEATYEVIAANGTKVVAEDSELIGKKLSKTHAEFYFILTSGVSLDNGVQVCVDFSKASTSKITEMYISRLEDRLIVAGGGGGAGSQQRGGYGSGSGSAQSASAYGGPNGGNQSDFNSYFWSQVRSSHFANAFGLGGGYDAAQYHYHYYNSIGKNCDGEAQGRVCSSVIDGLYGSGVFAKLSGGGDKNKLSSLTPITVVKNPTTGAITSATTSFGYSAGNINPGWYQYCFGGILSPKLFDTINNFKNHSTQRWDAIPGIQYSGCGMGGHQHEGESDLGRGEDASYPGATGGGGGGYRGGFVTNTNGLGAGGGCGWAYSAVSDVEVRDGANDGNGKVSIMLYEHTVSDGYSIAFGFMATAEDALRVNKRDYAGSLTNNQYGPTPVEGQVQEWIAPTSGVYKLEVWGAAGGDIVNSANMGVGEYRRSDGSGGYAAATAYIEKGTKLYVYVGGKGNDVVYGTLEQGAGGWNGGGDGGLTASTAGAGGGGATHISLSRNDAIVNPLLTDDPDVTKANIGDDTINPNTIIVAAGGGGGDAYRTYATSNGNELYYAGGGPGGYGWTNDWNSVGGSAYSLGAAGWSTTNGTTLAEGAGGGSGGGWRGGALHSPAYNADTDIYEDRSPEGSVYGPFSTLSQAGVNSGFANHLSIGTYKNMNHFGGAGGTNFINIGFDSGDTNGTGTSDIFNVASDGDIGWGNLMPKPVVMKYDEYGTYLSMLQQNDRVIWTGSGINSATDNVVYGNYTTNEVTNGNGYARITRITEAHTGDCSTTASDDAADVTQTGDSLATHSSHACLHKHSKQCITYTRYGFYNSADETTAMESVMDPTSGLSELQKAVLRDLQGSKGSLRFLLGNSNTLYQRVHNLAVAEWAATGNDDNQISMSSARAAVKFVDTLSISEINGIPSSSEIFQCNDYPLNYCDGECMIVNKILDCHEPHHTNGHYESLSQYLEAIGHRATEADGVDPEAVGVAWIPGTITAEERERYTYTRKVQSMNPDGTTTEKEVEIVNFSCYDACGDDHNHLKTPQGAVVDAQTVKGAFFINTDEYFDIYFPTTGNFYESNDFGISQTQETLGKGYTADMDTKEWIRERYVKFDFDVLFYRTESGLWEQYNANEWIELPVKNGHDDFYSADTSDGNRLVLTYAGDQFDVGDRDIVGGEGVIKGAAREDFYSFYCTLNNNEQGAAKVTMEAEAINNPNGTKGKYLYRDKYPLMGATVTVDSGDYGEVDFHTPSQEVSQKLFNARNSQSWYYTHAVGEGSDCHKTSQFTDLNELTSYEYGELQGWTNPWKNTLFTAHKGEYHRGEAFIPDYTFERAQDYTDTVGVYEDEPDMIWKEEGNGEWEKMKLNNTALKNQLIDETYKGAKEGQDGDELEATWMANWGNAAWAGDIVFEGPSQKLLVREENRYNRVYGARDGAGDIDDDNPATNHKNDNDNKQSTTNKDRKSNLRALHGATIGAEVDLVGRIGNLLLIHSTDHEWANFFKEPDGTGNFIPGNEGTVLQVDKNQQRNYFSWHILAGGGDNRLTMAQDIRNRWPGRVQTEEPGFNWLYDTWKTQMWKSARKGAEFAEGGNANVTIDNESGSQLDIAAVKSTKNFATAPNLGEWEDHMSLGPINFPISPDKNNLKVFKDAELMKLGHKINFEISTTGNYTQRLQVIPYFYALSLSDENTHKKGSLIPVDVYMQQDELYTPLNYWGSQVLNKYGQQLYPSDKITEDPYPLEIDWDLEKSERMITGREDDLNMLVHTTIFESVKVGDGTGDDAYKLVPTPVPGGLDYNIGSLNLMELGKYARTFIGQSTTSYENFIYDRTKTVTGIYGDKVIDISDTNFENKFDLEDYAYRAQRWFLTIGLPDSAVFVPYDGETRLYPTDQVDGVVNIDPPDWDEEPDLSDDDTIVGGEIIGGGVTTGGATDKMLAMDVIGQGKYAIVMTVNIRALGPIWNIYYEQYTTLDGSLGDTTGVPLPTLGNHKGDNGSTVLNKTRFNFTVDDFQNITGFGPEHAQTVLGVYNNEKAADLNVDLIGTH